MHHNGFILYNVESDMFVDFKYSASHDVDDTYYFRNDLPTSYWVEDTASAPYIMVTKDEYNFRQLIDEFTNIIFVPCAYNTRLLRVVELDFCNSITLTGLHSLYGLENLGQSNGSGIQQITLNRTGITTFTT